MARFHYPTFSSLTLRNTLYTCDDLRREDEQVIRTDHSETYSKSETFTRLECVLNIRRPSEQETGCLTGVRPAPQIGYFSVLESIEVQGW